MRKELEKLVKHARDYTKNKTIDNMDYLLMSLKDAELALQQPDVSGNEANPKKLQSDEVAVCGCIIPDEKVFNYKCFKCKKTLKKYLPQTDR